MHDPVAHIPEPLMLARLAQSEQMREFFIRMWLENPSLAAHAGSRVRDIMSPLAVPPGPSILCTS